MNSTLRVLAVMVVLLFWALPVAAAPDAPQALAATCTWSASACGSGGSCFYDWSNSANWSGCVPDTVGEDASISVNTGSATNYTIDVKANTTIGSLTMTTSGSATFNLRISNGATLTVSGACSANKTSGGDLWITVGAVSNDGTLYCQGAATFGTSGVASVILRNATNTGTFRFDGNWTMGPSAVVDTTNAPDLFLLGGAGNQTVTFNTASAPIMTALEVSKGSGTAVATVAGSQVATVNALTLSQGLLKLSSNLNISTGGSIGGNTPNSTNMVVTDTDGSATGDGYLCKLYTAASGDPDGTNGFTFPVGDTFGTTEYTPAVYNFTSNTTRTSGATICVKVTDSAYSSIPSNRASSLSRYWSVYSSNITFTSNPAVSFTYADGDVTLVSPALETSIKYQHSENSGSTWAQGAGTNDTTNTLSGTVGALGTSGTPSVHTGFSQSPTAVTLESMEAVQAPAGGRIDVTWQTAQETDNQGFNLWRGTARDDPNVIKLNAAIIPSQAPGGGLGASYAYADTYQLTAGTTYYYWLEDVALDGTTGRHEPVTVTYTGPTAVGLAGFGATSALPAALPLAGAGLALAAGAAVWARRRR